MKIRGIRNEGIRLERDSEGKLEFAEAIPQKVAEHDPTLTYQEQDPDGMVRTYPITERIEDEKGRSVTVALTHPHGNRRFRRARQRHNPKFTKPTHKGRDWWRIENG